MLGGALIVIIVGAGCRQGRADRGLELRPVEKGIGGGSDTGRAVVFLVVLARKVSPFRFLADDPAGQTEAAGIAHQVARAIPFQDASRVFFAFGAGFIIDQVPDPGFFQRLLDVGDGCCSVCERGLITLLTGYLGVSVDNAL